MSDLKISQLTALAAVDVASTDVLPIVDTSATTTKKITAASVATYVAGTTDITNLLAAKQDVVAGVDSTEIGYLNGVTSAIQTQLDGKQAIVSGVDSTEIGYLNGVTSAIQTQLDDKVAKTLIDAKGDLLVGSADNTAARLQVGTNTYVLTANSSATYGVEWAAVPASASDSENAIVAGAVFS